MTRRESEKSFSSLTRAYARFHRVELGFAPIGRGPIEQALTIVRLIDSFKQHGEPRVFPENSWYFTVGEHQP